MTTLLSWISVDDRGPSAIYIVSDSRITWGSANQRWDSGRKVYAANSADIFGYCGEVLFPSLALGQLTDLIDRQLLWSSGSYAKTRHAIIIDFLRTSFERRRNAPNYDFSIIHCSRDGKGLDSVFHCWLISFHAQSNSWSDSSIDVSHEGNSKVLAELGSGTHPLKREIRRWNESPQGETARAIFSAFCDALEKGSDSLSGGMPQLVSLDRHTNGKVIGFVSKGVRYIHGLPVKSLPALDTMEWVDSLFQRVSPSTLDLLSGAQPHVRSNTPKKGGLLAFLKRPST